LFPESLLILEDKKALVNKKVHYENTKMQEFKDKASKAYWNDGDQTYVIPNAKSSTMYMDSELRENIF
jgi:hypothetical protein